MEDNESGSKYALKELRSNNRSEEKKSRFVSEIMIASDNAAMIPGIIPVIDYSIEDYWYTMPIAQSIMDFVNGKSLNEIIDGVLQMCETLCKLHDKGIHHRDIKPSNIYYYDGRYAFGDFGLVDFPDNDDFTKSDRGLGAIFTIAPEMKRNPKLADASKADVFSLAKTLWMFLSGDEKGFDGVYDYLDQSHSLRYVSRFKEEHLAEIDELLKDATENNPDLRPDIYEFTKRLLLWREIAGDFDKSQNSDWKFLTKQLFGKNVPGSSVWREVDAIINVLNIVGSTPAYNHMLLSDRGGTDFEYARRAPEESCIYLYDTKILLRSVEISKEDYKKIITGVLQERPIDQIEGISDVIDKMTENVEFADRFMNKNGSLRKTPLKKKRAISKLEFFIPEYEYRRLKKMKDPIETLERPVEHMTVYRNDGSSVTLTAENGRVSIVDSREKNVRHIIEADYFVSKIL